MDIKHHDFKKFEFSKIPIPQQWLKSKRKTDCENFRIQMCEQSMATIKVNKISYDKINNAIISNKIETK